jgi:streptomycin 6-kinase
VIEIPEAFIRSTTDREGKRGAQWLATLPELITTLFERWGCLADGSIVHGEIGVVVPVLRDQGPAVIKVSFPHPENVYEPDAFEAWRGHGAVLMYEREDECFAILLERAGSRTLAELHDNDKVERLAGQINRRLAIPAPPGLPRLRDRMPQWEASLYQDSADFARALPRPVVEAAVATLRELGTDQPELVIHVDLHARNILSAEREPWLVVDPKGLVGDPAYDGGTFLKTHVFALLEEDKLDRAVTRCLEMFAEAAELDGERVRRWAHFRAVESAFWRRRHRFALAGGSAAPDRLTELADHLARVLV